GFDGLAVDLGDAPNAVALVMDASFEERDDQIAVFDHGGAITGFEFIGRIGGTDFGDELRQPGLVNNEFLTGGGDDTIAPGFGIDVIDGGETPTDPSLPTDADLLILDYSEGDLGVGVMMATDRNGALTATRRFEVTDTITIVDDLNALNIEYAHITGSVRNDVLEGINDPFYDATGDTIIGHDGDDVIRSYNGADDLQGGAGGDVLSAGSGDDRLQGGLAERDDGADNLTGGSGADLFVLGDQTGQHYGEQVDGAQSADFAVITDFATGVDQIQLVGSPASYDLVDFGGDTFVRHVTDNTFQTIARVQNVTGLDLESDDFTYVAQSGGGPGDVIVNPLPSTKQDPLPNVSPSAQNLAVDDLSDGVPDPAPFVVTQGEAATNLGSIIAQSLSAQGIAVGSNSIRIERDGDARAFGTFENGLGLDSGVALSTGDVRDWAGTNTEDGGIKSHLFGGNQFDLSFEKIGVLGPEGSPMTFYRANLADVPVSVQSLVLVDDDDGTGGLPSARSGADIAGLALTTLDIADIEELTGGDVSLLADSTVLPRLDLFDFSPLSTFFEQGEMRPFNPAETGGGGIGGIGMGGGDDVDLPTSVGFGQDTDGAASGFVNNFIATLGQFDYDAGERTGYLSLGDGGQLGLNLSDVIAADDEVWLIVAEAGGSESFNSTFTASPQSLIPPGDASTDFGAPGAEDDTITYTIEFEADLSPRTGTIDPEGPDEAYVRLFDAILGSEELREFAGTAQQDGISIRINGVEAAFLLDGQAASLDRLAAGVSGPFHEDLVPNWDGVNVHPTQYDAFASLVVEGTIVEGLNRVEIVLSDERDGYLDTGLLLAAAQAGPTTTPQAPQSTTFGGEEDTTITGALPNSAENPFTYAVAFDSGPGNGTLILSPDGTFTYTPDPDFNGQDSFVYIRTDASGAETFGQALIDVSPVADAPEVDAAQVVITTFDGIDIGPIDASDADSDPLSYTVAGGPDAAALSVDPGTGVLSFLTLPDMDTPQDANGDGIFEVTIAVSDGAESREAEVRIYVLEDDFTVTGAVVEGSADADTANGDATQTGPQPTELDDLIYGFAGADVLEGLAGNDVVNGGDDDDTLSGGPGQDTLTGGDGADAFIIAPGDENILITDFELGTDTLDLTGFSRENALAAINSAQAGSAILTFADGTLLAIEGANVTPQTLMQEEIKLREEVTPDQLINGTSAADTLTGGIGNDTLNGLEADDRLIGGEGDDTLDGGAGVDTAYFSGPQSSYTLTLSPTGTTVEDRRGNGNGTDRLLNVELLDFDVDFLDPTTDTPFDLRSFGGPTGLSESDFENFIELYIAYFNRAPDAVGLNFWGTQFANGTTLPEMAALFGPQPETIAAYPAGTTNQIFATTVYDNVLGRTPDQAGIDFWVGLLDAGTVSRDQFILEVLRGAKSDLKPELGQDFVDQQLADQAFLSDKTDIGAYFAVIKGMSDTANAAAAMALFDGSTSSRSAAVTAIDGYFTAALDGATGEFLMPLVGVLDDPFA
ncbi:MAG: DUF4214 domain-containing protein, partial [Rhodobacteraceae bacterium]|nr:DUF4214 domain-containing protein [Paracoccaceae bacterium]